MKNIFTSSLLIFTLLFGASTAAAQVTTTVEVDAKINGKAGEHRQEMVAPTPDESRAHGEDKNDSISASTTANAHGQLTAEAHRSAVAAFVESLLSVADRDGGIGAEVRAVAQSQREHASTTAEAVAEIESRGAVTSFLFGTDWENLGTVRSTVARGSADIQRLEAALEETNDASVRADLEVQIEALKNEQQELETFVSEHESRFSLFGWFTKLFAESEV